MAQVEVKVPTSATSSDVAVIEVMVKARRDDRRRHRSDDGRVGQGVDGDPVVACRRSSGHLGQGQRQGQRRLGDPVVEGRQERRLSHRPPRRLRRPRPRPRCSGGRADSRRRHLRRQGRCRVRSVGSRCRPGWLLRGLPQRRPRHEDRARRTLCATLGGVPERRLHSEQGLLHTASGDGRSPRRRSTTASSLRTRRSTSTGCAAQGRRIKKLTGGWRRPRRARSRCSRALAAS